MIRLHDLKSRIHIVASSAVAFVVASSVGVALSGCSGKSSYSQSHPVDSISVDCVDSLMANAADIVGKCVTLVGTCRNLGLYEGRQMFIDGSSDSIFIRCDATPSMGGRFAANVTGKKVKVTGLMQELKIDEAYLDKLEIRYNEQSRLLKDNKEADDTNYESTTINIGFPGLVIAPKQHNDTAFTKSIEYYRQLISERSESGTPYLSFYYIDTTNYEIID